jgi:hypothetical protein
MCLRKAENEQNGIETIIGKSVDLHKAAENDFEFEDSTFGNPVLKVPLYDFKMESTTDSCGFNAYAVLIFLENMVVKHVQRFGYLHFRGGGSIGCKLEVFKSLSLEKEAERKIMRLVCE